MRWFAILFVQSMNFLFLTRKLAIHGKRRPHFQAKLSAESILPDMFLIAEDRTACITARTEYDKVNVLHVSGHRRSFNSFRLQVTKDAIFLFVTSMRLLARQHNEYLLPGLLVVQKLKRRTSLSPKWNVIAWFIIIIWSCPLWFIFTLLQFKFTTFKPLKTNETCTVLWDNFRLHDKAST